MRQQKPIRKPPAQKVFDSAPAHSSEAEMCALGAAMLSRKAMSTLLGRLTKDHFYLPAHKVIFRAIQICDLEDIAADLVTVKNQLVYTEDLQAACGIEYLINLNEIVPTASHAEHYCQIVEDYWILRELQSRCKDTYETVASPDLSIGEKLQRAAEVTKGLTRSANLVHHVSEVEVGDEEADALPWMIGGGKLQESAYGLHMGQITTLEFPTGHGKTMTAIQTVDEQLKMGRPCIYVTLADLQPRHIKMRLLTMRTGLRSCPKGPEDGLWDQDKQRKKERWDAEVARINSLPLRIYNAAQLGGDPTIEGIMATLTKAMDELPASVVVIDYAQKLTSREKSDSLTSGATTIAAKLGLFAGAYPKTAFLVLSQISKDGDTAWAREWMNQAAVRVQGTIEDGTRTTNGVTVNWKILKNRFWPTEGMSGTWRRDALTGVLMDE